MVYILDKIIFVLKLLIDRLFSITPDIVLDKAITLGDAGASFTVDPTNLTNESVVYSFGVGFNISFDRELIEKYGVKIYSFDPTPKSINWLKQQIIPNGFAFENIGIANYDGYADLFLPKNEHYVSGTIISGTNGSKKISIPVQRLKTIMGRFGHHKIDLLKMDIEGAEYGVIDDIIENKILVEQIVVEFHHRFKGISMWATHRATNKLRKAGYKLFSVSLTKEEYSFIKQ